MITRRTAAGVLAGLPFVGKAAGANAVGGINGLGNTQASPPTTPYPTPDRPQMAKVPEWRALRLAMQDPDLRREIVSMAFEQHRTVLSVDPDIEVMRSFSPMAKITFQRQRNVGRYIQQQTETPKWEMFSPLREFIKKAMWG